MSEFDGVVHRVHKENLSNPRIREMTGRGMQGVGEKFSKERQEQGEERIALLVVVEVVRTLTPPQAARPMPFLHPPGSMPALKDRLEKGMGDAGLGGEEAGEETGDVGGVKGRGDFEFGVPTRSNKFGERVGGNEVLEDGLIGVPLELALAVEAAGCC